MNAQSILVIAAHPDDETLGCGATLAKHVQAGDTVAAIFLTDGVSARLGASPGDIKERQHACARALELLGVDLLRHAHFPDNALDSVPLIDLVRAIEATVASWGRPDVVYTHHAGDLNIDHERVHRAVLTAFRPLPSTVGLPREILTFEVPSSTGWRGASNPHAFQPNHFVDVTSTLPAKIEATRAYAEEMPAWPHARSVEAVEHLARYRGSIVGLAAAEAFVIERSIR